MVEVGLNRMVVGAGILFCFVVVRLVSSTTPQVPKQNRGTRDWETFFLPSCTYIGLRYAFV